MLIAMILLIEDARVERLMPRSYPGLCDVRAPFHAPDADGLGFDALSARLERALHDTRYMTDNYRVNKGRTRFEASVDRLDDQAPFEGAAKVLANDLRQSGGERHVVPHIGHGAGHLRARRFRGAWLPDRRRSGGSSCATGSRAWQAADEGGHTFSIARG
ncbi:hypothetical protein [Paraburkholderia oxyphila]|uniref:hypothetical protein n=1 Tax=Paraburkholderia oxyphila TaxID=614212 RepID=UPI0004836D72|nr:hypothetical protein [Paraburkholderia oxyphila]